MIYLDYSATTPVDERVLNTFNKVCTEYPGNSNSLHSLGLDAKKIEEYATEKLGKMLGVMPSEIIYTSGASESNNTAIKGICLKYQNRGKHIISTKLEHSSVIETLKYLEKLGFTIDYVNISDNGLVDLEDLKNKINDETILVTIALVDSEIGIRQPIEEINEIVKEYPKCYLHVDMTQALGKIPINLSLVDLASMSLHKIFGMKGIGILYKKEKILLEPLIHGGKSTTPFRSGTPALPLIVSSMKAIELVIPEVNKHYEYVSNLNKKIITKFREYPLIHINSTCKSIPYIINFSLLKIKPETFLHALDSYKVYISTKSACASTDKLSESVLALTKDKYLASHSLRISLSYKTTEEEIDRFLEIFDICYKKLDI